MNKPKIINIHKQDFSGRVVWKYTGSLLEYNQNRIVIEAYFDREDTPLDKIILRKGDKFIETYFTDQWFNIYEIQDKFSESIKAWYCNISYPAVFTNETITFRDLALDLLVYPDGTSKTLDLDEFNSLPIPDEIRSKALQSLAYLQDNFPPGEMST
jgi:protein associated with RNAse G/E